MGKFIDEYEEETVFHKINHQYGTEYIKRSYVGKIQVEAILPGFKNLEFPRLNYPEIPVTFTKSDLEALKKAEVFLIEDKENSYVRPLRDNYPHLEQIKEILSSGAYYLRPYEAFIGTWVGTNESGEDVALLTLERHGFGTWGKRGGQQIRWKPFKDHLSVYFTGGILGSGDDNDETVKMDLVVDKETNRSSLSYYGITYQLAEPPQNFNGILDRMLELQRSVEPSDRHPALGVWRLKYPSGISEVRDFQFVAFNPDSSLYWFNSDKELKRFGSWKAIAGEDQFFVKWEKDRGHLAEVVHGSDDEDHLILSVFRGIRMTDSELETLSIPNEVELPNY